MKSKKVLIITESFPPEIVGNVRMVKFAKYLPKFGWEPHILTISKRAIVRYDHTLEANVVPESRIHRAFYPNPFIFFDRRYYNETKGEDKVASNKEHTKGSNNSLSHRIISVIKKVIGNGIWFVRSNFFIPNETITWLPFAICKGIYVCHKYNIDMLLSTGPSFVNHLVALGIKKFTGKNWVADYRNLWTDNDALDPITPPIRAKFERALDLTVLKHCDVITVIAELMKDAIIKSHPSIQRNKIVCIDNGYDLSDFDGIVYQTAKGNKQLTITYTGAIYRDYPTPLFLAAIGELINEYPDMKNSIKVNFVGTIKESQRKRMQEVINQFQLQNIVAFKGQVTRKESLQYQKNADVLLVMFIAKGVNIETVVPGKLFDYIAAKRPILALVPDGTAADIMKLGKCGVVVYPDDFNGIKKCILEFYRKFVSNQLAFYPDWTSLENFDRKNLTGQLANIFDLIGGADHV